MNKKTVLCVILSTVLFSMSVGASTIEEVTIEDKQRILNRMSNISPEDKQRLNQRFLDIQAASKADAEKAIKDAEKANPACKVVLCMFGKLKGVSPAECKSAEKEYFSITVRKRKKIRWDRTAVARLNFLNRCPSPENDAINRKFGRVLR